MSDPLRTNPIEPFVELEGICLTRSELLEIAGGYASGLLLTLETEGMDNADHTDSNTSIFSTVVLGAFSMLQALQEDPTYPEDVRLETEAMTAEIASEVATNLAKSGLKRHVQVQRALQETEKYTKQPLRIARDLAEANERTQIQAEKRKKALQEIEEIERKYAVTSAKLKSYKYKIPGVEGVFDGRKLRHELGHVSIPGTDSVIFHEQEAQVLAGKIHEDEALSEIPNNFLNSMAELAILYESLRRNGGTNTNQHGIFSAFNKVQELLECPDEELNRLHAKNPHFGKLLTWARNLFSDEYPDEKIVPAIEKSEAEEIPTTDKLKPDATFDEGPFMSCPELPIIAFNGKLVDGESTKELDPQLVTDENILDDITAAVSRSDGAHLVEVSRITQFTDVLAKLQNQYGMDKIKIYRTLRPNWHSLPWYVIEISPQFGTPMTVLETPIAGNATYFINNGDWFGTIHFRRTEAQKLGAKPIIHVRQVGHTEKILDCVTRGGK